MLIAAEVGAALVTARSGKQAAVLLGDLAMCVGGRQSVHAPVQVCSCVAHCLLWLACPCCMCLRDVDTILMLFGRCAM
jgi:hypothetical protein